MDIKLGTSPPSSKNARYADSTVDIHCSLQIVWRTQKGNTTSSKNCSQLSLGNEGPAPSKSLPPAVLD